MHQDKVRIIIRNDKKEGKRQEGVVVKVLERGMPEIVGTYQLNRDFGFVISDKSEIFQRYLHSEKRSGRNKKW